METTMSADTLTFAAVSTAGRSGSAWLADVRRLEALGFGAILVPDTVRTPSPFPALAAAGAVTSTLRLRTWVLAAPLRTAPAVVREARALQQLSDGRFELGLGTGRPGAEDDAERLGVAWPDMAGRIAHLEDIATAVRDTVTPVPSIAVTGSGPKVLGAAGRVADRVGLALGPTTTSDDLRAAAERAHDLAPHARLSMQVMGVGGRVSTFLERQGLTAAALEEMGSVGVLRGDLARMAETLSGWQETHGIDEIVVPAEFAEDVAPLVARRAA